MDERFHCRAPPPPPRPPRHHDSKVMDAFGRTTSSLQSLGDVEALLDTSISVGLTEVEAQRRRALYGVNAIRECSDRNLFREFIGHFIHLMALLLWFAGALALVGKLPELAIAIWLINVINGLFSFYQGFKADRAAAALKARMPRTCLVRRDGKDVLLRSSELVPGDVVVLEQGNRVSADVRVVEASQLSVDQSAFTGESLPVPKCVFVDDMDTADEHDGTNGSGSADGRAKCREGDITGRHNLLFASTTVLTGSAVGVVYATAMSTRFGRVADTTMRVRVEKSPLEKELGNATAIITLITICIGVTFFLLSHFIVHADTNTAFVFAIGMAVAFVPEGLLPLVTLSLARGSMRILNRGAIVRQLSSVETLGCTSVICSDKTGTLTRNMISASKIWYGGIEMDVLGRGYSPQGSIVPANDDANLRSNQLDPLQHELLLAGCLCNNSRLLHPDQQTDEQKGAGRAWVVAGDPTEGALRVLAAKGHVSVEREEARHVRVGQIPFSSSRKRMTTIHAVPRGDGTARIAFVKGAPDAILGLCTLMHTGLTERAMSSDDKHVIQRKIQEYAANGQRVLGIARRKLSQSGSDAEYVAGNIEQKLTFLGLVAMFDPPRQGVREAIRKCHTAGIRVIMITGDHALTARNIALQIGIGPQDDFHRGDSYDSSSSSRSRSRSSINNNEEKDRVGGYGGDDTAQHKESLLASAPNSRVADVEDGESYRARLNSPIHLVHGPDLEDLSMDDLMGILDRHFNIVFARTSPEQKMKIVIALKNQGHIVAVTGDGVNDAPALRAAHIGVSMGLSGQDVAREASDMVLEDDNFATIVMAVEEGRAVFDNIKKFVTYILTSNAAEAIPFVFFVCSAGRISLALPVILVLAIDLGTDMLPALALGADPPEPGIMRRHPRKLDEPFFTPFLIVRSLCFLGIVQGLMAMFAFYFHFWQAGLHKWVDLPKQGALYEQACTVAFLTVVSAQVANVFICRSETVSVFRLPLCSNQLIWIGLMFEIAFACILVYVPFLQKSAGVRPFRMWPSIVVVLSAAPVFLLFSELRKAVANAMRCRRAK